MDRRSTVNKPDQAGFTLLEVLVALALVAGALGGTLAVLRQAIDTQSYLERRLLAQWVAENVMNELTLVGGDLTATEKNGRETMLGRRYRYTISVTPVVDSLDGYAGSDDAGHQRSDIHRDDRDNSDSLGLSTESGPAFDDVVVDVRDAVRQVTPLARLSRRLPREAAL